MDNNDIELVTKITKEQETLRVATKKVEAQILGMLEMIKKASIHDAWWLDTARRNLLTGLSAARSAIYVPINEQTLALIKKSQAPQSSQSEAAQEPAVQSPAQATGESKSRKKAGASKVAARKSKS